MCSNVNCSKSPKCICYKRYKKILEEDENDDDSNYFWDRRSRRKASLIDNFLENLPIDEHHRKHGYNKTKIKYPIKRNHEMQRKFLDRLDGIFNLPEKIIPEVCEEDTCIHGHPYTSHDECLKMMSPNITIYTESHDKICKIPTFGRPTVGDCICMDQKDTNDLLLWNLGSGKHVDYLFLHNHVHRMVSSGIAMNASFNARKTSLSDIGVQSSLTYQHFVRACTGYARMIAFDRDAFLCSTCGDDPKYLVCDGKTDGPTKRKVAHLHELDKAEADESFLCQGSHFENRVFLSESSERKLVCCLLTDAISVDDFILTEDISSPNGNLVLALVRRISLSWPGDIPKPYERIIGNICKAVLQDFSK